MRGNIYLHVGWSRLSELEKMWLRSHYHFDRRHGFSVTDARYFANACIDIMMDNYNSGSN